jgi:hypothetical protein
MRKPESINVWTQELNHWLKRLPFYQAQKYFHTTFALPSEIMVNSGQGRLEKW